MIAAIDGFVIAVPPDWIRIPLDRTEFDRAIKASRKRFASDTSISKTDLHRLDLLIAALRNDFESANVRLLAALIMNVEAETQPDSADRILGDEEIRRKDGNSVAKQGTSEGEVTLLLATVSVSVMSRFDLGSDVPLTPAVLKVAFDLEHERSPDHYIRVTNLDPPEIVQLPAGESVKLVQLHSRRRAGPVPADVFVQQFYIPLDPGGDEAALILFTSPSIEVAQPLSELFDAMMDTFEILSDRDGLDVDRATS